MKAYFYSQFPKHALIHLHNEAWTSDLPNIPAIGGQALADGTFEVGVVFAVSGIIHFWGILKSVIA